MFSYSFNYLAAQVLVALLPPSLWPVGSLFPDQGPNLIPCINHWTNWEVPVALFLKIEQFYNGGRELFLLLQLNSDNKKISTSIIWIYIRSQSSPKFTSKLEGVESMSRKKFWVSYIWCVCVHTESCPVTESCPTLYYFVDCTPPGSSVHGIFQARLLEWVADRVYQNIM